MTSILVLGSQISSKRKSNRQIYFVVSGKWNSLTFAERVEFNSILSMFMIHVRFSDENGSDEMYQPSEYITKVENDTWSILEMKEPSYIKHDIHVDFKSIYKSLQRR